jgi:hypothetical protein
MFQRELRSRFRVCPIWSEASNGRPRLWPADENGCLFGWGECSRWSTLLRMSLWHNHFTSIPQTSPRVKPRPSALWFASIFPIYGVSTFCAGIISHQSSQSVNPTVDFMSLVPLIIVFHWLFTLFATLSMIALRFLIDANDTNCGFTWLCSPSDVL